MGRMGLYLAWTFVFLVTGYDMYFAWSHREGFGSWELNPVARYLVQLCGMGVVFAFKIAVIGFAAWVAAFCYRRRRWLTALYTAIISGLHLWLSCHYVLGYLR